MISEKTLIKEVKEGKTEGILAKQGVVKVSTKQLEDNATRLTSIEKLGCDVAEDVVKWKIQEDLSYSKISQRLVDLGHEDITPSLVQSFFAKYSKIKDKIMEDNVVLRRRLIRRTLKHQHDVDQMINALREQLAKIQSNQDMDEVERTSALSTLVRTTLDAIRSDSKILKETRTDTSESKPTLTQINITNKIGKEKAGLRSELLSATFDTKVMDADNEAIEDRIKREHNADEERHSEGLQDVPEEDTEQTREDSQ